MYQATDRFPPHERFGLTSQVHRAAISAAVNIAEGYGRNGRGELRRFIGYSLGSLSELDALLLIASARGYLDAGSYAGLREGYVSASKTTYALLRSIRR